MTGNAGKFLTVAVDGESLTMVDEPQGDIQGSGVDGQITYWDGTKTVTSDAMLLIDTTNKTLKIVIPLANGSGGISLNAVSASATSSLTFLNNGVTMAQLYYDNSTANLRLASDGDVEISPSGTLSVDSGATFSGDVTVSKSGDAGINLNSTTTNGVAVTRYGTTPTGNLWATGINITNSDSRWELYNFGLASSPLIISSGGDATFSGKLSVSKSSTNFIAEFQNTNGTTPYGVRVKDATSPANNYPLFSVSNSGGTAEYFRVNSGTGVVNSYYGIAFPNQSAGSGTVASSTLDAYEEGTWTATLTPASGTINMGVNVGQYIRIGRQVTISGLFDVASVITPTGDLTFSLPYAVGSGNSAFAAASIWGNTFTTGAVTSLTGMAYPSRSELYIYNFYQGSVYSLSSFVQTGTTIIINCTYFI